MNRKSFPLVCSAGLLIVLLLSACGTNTGAGSTGAYGGGGSSGASQTATAAASGNANATATAAAVATNNAYSGGGYGGCSRYCSGSPTSTTGGGSTVAIKTATITVGGKSETVLTNAQGLTLYYRTSDTTSSVCSGGCASAWPPVIAPSTPTAPTSLPGKLGLLNDANGSQVTYNGHPLYTYGGDSGPGQSNGQGFGGIWFVVTTGLAA